MKPQSYRGIRYHWYSPVWQRDREHAALEREATAIIKQADRRRRTWSRPPGAARAPMPALPQRYTLDDLGELRKRGLVP